MQNQVFWLRTGIARAELRYMFEAATGKANASVCKIVGMQSVKKKHQVNHWSQLNVTPQGKVNSYLQNGCEKFKDFYRQIGMYLLTQKDM